MLLIDLKYGYCQFERYICENLINCKYIYIYFKNYDDIDSNLSYLSNNRYLCY